MKNLKRAFLSVYFFLFINSSFSQEFYKSGYYVDNKGNKILGLILDDNVYNNPTQISFKSSENEPSKIIILSDLQEFFITENNVKYQKFTFDVDVNYTRSNNLESMTSQKVKVTSLLKVLVEGDLSLYKLVINDKVVFFYKSNNDMSAIELENTKYVNKDGNLVEEKSFFRRQLIKIMICNDFKTIPSFLELGYNEKELVKLFQEYNTCKKSNFTVYKEEKRNQKSQLKFTPYLGTNFSSIKYDLRDTPFAPKSSVNSLNFGVETALVLPYNNKSYELFLGIGVEKINNVSSTSRRSGTFTEIFENFTFKSTLMYFNFGPRYNYNLNKSNKLFFDVSLGLSIPQEDVVYENYSETTIGDVFYTTQGNDIRYSTDSTFYFTVGIGYCFNNKFGLDFRYSSPKEFLEGQSLTVNLSSIGGTLRYTIN